MTNLVKAYNEIVSVKIGEDIVSMTIAEKENESGLKFNQRLFILVHSQYFGYISKVKINEEAEKIDISSAKVKVPIKNLYTSQTEDCLLKIQFTTNVQGKIVPKEWIFQMTTSKLAQLWKQLLDYQVKMRNKVKKSPKKEEKSVQIEKPKKTQRSATKDEPKIQTDRSMELPKQSKIEITTPQAAGKFDADLFSDSDEENNKSKSKKKQPNKQSEVSKQKEPNNPPVQKPIVTKKKEQQVQDKAKDTKKPKVSLAPIQVEEQKKDKSIPQKQQLQAQVKRQPVVEQSIVGLPLIEEQIQSVPSHESKVRKSDNNKSSILSKQKEEIATSNINRQSKHSKQKQQSVRKPSSSISKSTKLVKQKERVSQKQPSAEDKEVAFVKQILHKLDQKNEKFPINQITYNRQEMGQLINIFKDRLSKTIHNKDTQNRLNTIMDIQRQKMNKINADLQIKKSQNNNVTKNWIYKQITEQEIKCLIQFRAYCSNLMKELICQVYKHKYQKFKQNRSQNNIVYCEYEDLQIQVALIDQSDPKDKPSNGAQKHLKLQFKAYQYLYKIIENRGTIRVPLTCICQYAGITALFKAKPVYYQNDKYEETLNRQLDHLESISCLPLKKTLRNKIRPLNQFHYSEMREGQTDSNFKFHFVDQLTNIFIYDLNHENSSPLKVLRMEMIQQQIDGKILPFIPFDQTKNKTNFTKDFHLLSQKVLERIERVKNSLENLDFYFVNPKQLSDLMHANAVNMRYLGNIYGQSMNQFSRTCLLSQIMARSCKKLINKILQESFFQEKDIQVSIQNIQQLVNIKVKDFLNCLLGNNHQTEALWRIVKANAQQYYKVQLQGVQSLSKGQFLISLAHHLNLNLNWKKINASGIFQHSQFFQPHSNLVILLKSKTFKPVLSTSIHQISQRLMSQTQQNFKWFVETLNLKEQPFSDEVKQQQLTQKLRLYFCNFVEPEQTDWCNSYGHLSIYETDEPTLSNFRIDLLGIRWYLRKGNKFKYLNKFNDFTSKVQKLYGNNHPILSQLYELFSKHHRTKFQLQDSINFAKSSILNISGLCGDNNQFMAEKYYNIAQLLNCSKRDNQSLEYLKKAKKMIELSSNKKISLYNKIRVLLATIYFKQRKFQPVVNQLQNVKQLFQFNERQDPHFEQSRIKVYYLLYNSYANMKKFNQASQLCSYLQPKLKQFKVNIHYEQILWIIIENCIKTVSPQSRQSLFKIFDMINIKHSIQYYKKAYDLIRKRDQQKNLFKLFKTYAANSPRIFELITENRILQDWQNLAKIYERQSLFDFVSILQELIYFLGRDRLNTLVSS